MEERGKGRVEEEGGKWKRREGGQPPRSTDLGYGLDSITN